MGEYHFHPHEEHPHIAGNFFDVQNLNSQEEKMNEENNSEKKITSVI